MYILCMLNVPVGELTCGFTAFWDCVLSLKEEYIFTSKSFLQIRKTNLCWTQSTQILQRKSSDNCSFDSDKWVGAEFCPRGRGHRIGGQRHQNRKTVAVNAVVKSQELLPCYTRLCLSQRSTGATEKPMPLGPLCLPRLVMSQKRTCLKQQQWGQSEKKKTALCGVQMLPTLWARASLSTAAAADKFTSPRSTWDLTFKHDAGRKTVGDWSVGGIVRRE